MQAGIWQCLLQTQHRLQGNLPTGPGKRPLDKAPSYSATADCWAHLLSLALQAEAVKHTVGDKVHQAQHRAEGTWEEAYRKAPTGSTSQKASNHLVHCVLGWTGFCLSAYLFTCYASVCLSVHPLVRACVCPCIDPGNILTLEYKP